MHLLSHSMTMGIAEATNFRRKLDYFSNYNILIKSYMQCLLYISCFYLLYIFRFDMVYL